uniref:Cadherin domain-containing protein n=2 Tax=Scophthalmus maximus TaxID=52904 RepID=A0A8D3D4F1_SCOMX
MPSSHHTTFCSPTDPGVAANRRKIRVKSGLAHWHLNSRDMAALRRDVLLFLTVALLVSCDAAFIDVLYRVAEEQPPNTLIGSLAANQGLPDTGHLYKLEVGSPYLRVDNKTGDIYTTEIPIGREKMRKCRNRLYGNKCFLEFKVSITDMVKGLGSGPRLIKGRIEVLDNTPQLVVMGNLDRERKDSYNLNISVVDGGRPARASSALLRVTATDENDNAPRFERSHYEADLPENSPLGHSVLQVRANDTDTGIEGKIRYSLHKPLKSVKRLLRIDRLTGIIYVKGLVDREEENVLEFFVVAKHRGSNSKNSTVQVTISVKDQNDNPPAIEIHDFGLVTHHDGVANISEDMPIGTKVVLVLVSDCDEGENAVVTCVVTGDVPFQLQHDIESANNRMRKYFLQTTTLLDYERVKDYRIEIVAVDAGDPPRSSYVGVTINVLDENDNAPYVTKPANSSYTYLTPVTPPDTRVEVVEAEDIDSGPNAELVFSITGGNPFDLFHISPSSGEITLAKEFTGKHNGLHRLVVRVSDKGKPPRHTTALVHVFVNDTKSNVSVIEALVGHSLYTPLDRDIAEDPNYAFAHYSNILYGSLAGIAGVILVIVAAVVIGHRLTKDAKSGYQEDSLQKGFYLINESVTDIPRIHLPLNYPPGSPDLGPHYRSNSPLLSIQLQPVSSEKHQAVQDLPVTNTLVGRGDNNSTGSDQYSDYSYKANPPK